MKNKIAIYHHLGLGDAIDCNGMVRHFAEQYDHVDVFAQDKNYESCKFMYRDSEKIKVIAASNGAQSHLEIMNFFKEYDGEVIIPGHDSYFKNMDLWEKLNIACSEAFYYLANVPWEYKTTKFYVERNYEEEERVLKKLNPNNKDYIFVHDDPKRNLFIEMESKYKIIRNDPSVLLFNMLGVLENAKELHLMGSSLICLVDCLPLPNKEIKRYFHNFRNEKLGPNTMRLNWIIC